MNQRLPVCASDQWANSFEVTAMNRRAFARNLASSALVTPVLSRGSLLLTTRENRGPAPSYRLSVMLWTVFGNLPFPERLEKVAEAGYRNVELVGEFEKWTREDFRAITRKRQELGITFDATAGLAHGVADPRAREAFLNDVRRMLVTMERLECASLIVMSGDVVRGLSKEAHHESCVEGLKRAAEIVDGKRVTLLLENIDLEEDPHYYLWSVPEGFEIVRQVNHRQVKFLYDFFHAQISGGNLIENLERNIERVGLVHIADVPGRHEPGTGEINYANIYNKLLELNYSGCMAMEFLPSRDPVKTLRSAREMALRPSRTPAASEHDSFGQRSTPLVSTTKYRAQEGPVAILKSDTKSD